MKQALKNAITLGGSLAVVAVSGFFGGGGGMLCVPLLEYSGLDVKRAHATALVVILPICIVSSVVYIIGGYFDLKQVSCACLGVCIGAVIGAKLLDKITSSAVAIVFAALMIAVGVKSMIP